MTSRFLLQVYGGDVGWPFIEADAYKILIDTILDQPEEGDVGEERNENENLLTVGEERNGDGELLPVGQETHEDENLLPVGEERNEVVLLMVILLTVSVDLMVLLLLLVFL